MTELPPHFGVQTPCCPYCNTRITIHQTYMPGHCGAHDCRHKHAVAAGQKRDAVEHQEDRKRRDVATERAESARATIAAALDVDPDAVLIAILPYQNAPVVPLPDPVRADFVAHLEKTVAAAWNSVRSSADIARPALQPLRDPEPVEVAGCTACQGSCCRDGRLTHAFLSQTCMEDIVAAHPDLGVAELVAYYASAIPAESVKNACVYQTAKGCVLPRDWRSETCNLFRCGPLRQLSQMAPPGADLPVAIVAAQGVTVNILAHRDSRGTVPLPQAPPSD